MTSDPQSLVEVRAVVLAALLFANPLAGQDPPTPFFEAAAVADWEATGQEDTLPFRVEKMASQWVLGARSTSGSYVFVTRIDNTLARPAFAAEELLGFFAEVNYADLEPEDFLNELVEIEVSGVGTVRAVRSSFATAHLGYDVGQESGPAVVRSVLLPLTLWSQRRDLYVNWIYVADFRGAATATGDLEAFDRLWRSVSFPEEWAPIDLAEFNALRPTLLVRSEIAEPLPAPVVETTEPGVAVEALAEAMLRALSGRATDQDDQLLRDVRNSHRETVVAGVLDRVTEFSTRAWQLDVWEHAFSVAPAERRPRIVALFLAESIARGHRDLTREIARDTLERLGDLSAIPCLELDLLVDGLVRAPPIACWSSEPVRSFFQFGSKTACSDPGEILRKHGLALPEIGQHLLEALR